MSKFKQVITLSFSLVSLSVSLSLCLCLSPSLSLSPPSHPPLPLVSNKNLTDVWWRWVYSRNHTAAVFWNATVLSNVDSTTDSRCRLGGWHQPRQPLPTCRSQDKRKPTPAPGTHQSPALVKSFFPRTVRDWNRLPVTTTSAASLQSVQNQLGSSLHNLQPAAAAP